MYISLTNTIGALNRRASFVGILNTYSGAGIACSLRLLDGSYTGSSIRVRRSSDNTEQDIGFIDNILDTASLLTFVGSGDGFVSKWYDQSSNTRDMIQITASRQGQIAASGVVYLDGGLPIIRAVNGSTGMTSTYNATDAPTSKQFFAVVKSNYASVMLFGTAIGGNDYCYFGDSTTSTSIDRNIALSSELLNNQSFTYTTRADVYNGLSSQSILSASSVFSYGASFALGYIPNSSYYSMYDMQEFIVFENQTDQIAKVTAINNHYSAY
tara:strand:- start:262 stop:1068 length:807 start_codon:yes stop_codon:yes gene_type:complete